MRISIKDLPVLAIIGLIIGWIVWNQLRLDRDGWYTIGITEGRNGRDVKFYFEVNGIRYSGEYPIGRHSPDVNGGKYLVKFLPYNPNVNKIYFNREFKMGLNPPTNGWKEVDEEWFLPSKE